MTGVNVVGSFRTGDTKWIRCPAGTETLHSGLFTLHLVYTKGAIPMNDVLRKMVEDYIHNRMPEYIQTLYDVITIPSPTGEEEKKAQWILEQLEAMGAKGAYRDAAGNVIYPHCLEGAERFPLYTAHMDTVFAGVEKIMPEIDGHTLKAPSCGDNSSDVAALLFLIRMMLTLQLRTPVVFAFNVGEEGLGNLKGSRALTDAFGDRLSYFMAVDGNNDRFVNLAVGSRRYAVHVVTAGGHSYAAFGAANAINEAAGIIRDFYSLQVPKDPRTTYNVGTIQGGRTINSIADEVEFTVDMRSVSHSELEKLDGAFQAILQAHTTDQVKVETLLLGERPCSEGVRHHEIYDRITAIRKRAGFRTEFSASSTDANIPLSRNIPAIAFGICKGKGAHTLQEELDMTSLEPGLKQLAAFIWNL